MYMYSTEVHASILLISYIYHDTKGQLFSVETTCIKSHLTCEMKVYFNASEISKPFSLD